MAEILSTKEASISRGRAQDSVSWSHRFESRTRYSPDFHIPLSKDWLGTKEAIIERGDSNLKELVPKSTNLYKTTVHCVHYMKSAEVSLLFTIASDILTLVLTWNSIKKKNVKIFVKFTIAWYKMPCIPFNFLNDKRVEK